MTENKVNPVKFQPKLLSAKILHPMISSKELSVTLYYFRSYILILHELQLCLLGLTGIIQQKCDTVI